MRYNTGNPVEPDGSSSPFDLFDNAGNIDLAANGDDPNWIDRKGRARKSLKGMEIDFQNFLLASGYEYIGDYDTDSPLTIRRANQVFSKDGEYWRSGPSLSLPFTTTGSWAADGPLFVTVGDAVLRQTLASGVGGSMIGITAGYEGAEPRDLQAKLNEMLSVEDLGAKPAPFDSTLAFAKALATGRSFQCEGSHYYVGITIAPTADGQMISGNGKMGQTVIENPYNSNPLYQSSVGPGAAYKRRIGVRDIEFVGNPTTLGGMLLRGIISDGLTGDADKSCEFRNIKVRDVGAGPALTVNAWCNNLYSIELWDNYQGLKLGAEANAFGAYGLYITGCQKEAIVLPQGSGQPSVINFYNTTCQYSGGDEYMIDIRDGYAIKFYGLYLEGSRAPLGPINVGGQAAMVGFDNVMHNLVDGVPSVPIITTNVKHCHVKGIVNLGGAMASFVKITGTLPFTHVEGYHVAVGSVATPVDDQSTRRSTIVQNWDGSEFGMTTFKNLAAQHLTEWRTTEANTLIMYVDGGGRLVFGPDATAPTLSRAGGTMSLTYSAGIGTFRAPRFGIGADKLILDVPSSPEGAFAAPPGSLAMSSNGKQYTKDNGVGNIGWLQI
ncbi:hypothetical protein [Pseudomonas vranovensis]|uniref:hypothetical protein n=1 Tax=Pseudomonas vranovensis TaxID=321661 RepID=UPI0003FFE102|nr:hypothetical protein [Pseudomonas vranovensis]